jgi:hypothetical protein
LIRPFYPGLRIWVTGNPVLWRKGHIPEHSIGQRGLHSHLRMIALMPFNVSDNTDSSAAFVWTFDRVSLRPLNTWVDTGINAP